MSQSVSGDDTPPEAEFHALVTLVDAGRQWFNGRIGLDVGSTDRCLSFCGHMVADDAPLIVPDAAADTRFDDNSLVTGAPRTITPAQLDSLSLLAQQAVALLRMRRQTLGCWRVVNTTRHVATPRRLPQPGSRPRAGGSRSRAPPGPPPRSYRSSGS